MQMIQRALPFLCSFNQNIKVKSKEVSFSSTTALLPPNNMAENFRFCASCRSDRVLSMLFNSCLDALAHSVTEVVGFSFLSSNVLKNLANCCCHFVMKKPEIDLVDSNSVCNHTSEYQTRTNARQESHLSIMTMILDRIRRNEVLLPNNHNYYNFFLFSLFYITF